MRPSSLLLELVASLLPPFGTLLGIWAASLARRRSVSMVTLLGWAEGTAVDLR